MDAGNYSTKLTTPPIPVYSRRNQCQW